MKTVIITGSTRGIGYGLAKEFLTQGCQVTICGRNETTLEQAYQSLSQQFSRENMLGVTCDVGKFEDVQNLWNQTINRFKKVDIWINNAGLNIPRLPVYKQKPEEIKEIVDTNLTGTIYGAKVAISEMKKQGFGAVYLMEGSGSDGMKVKYLTLYGTTKYAIRFLKDSLVQETKNTNIIVGAISPGIVITDLITKQYIETEEQKQMWEKAKQVFNILADKVETVTPYLVEKILDNNKTGVRIAWLNIPKVAQRFLCSPFNKRNLFD
jgi:short-subunit dehydrogenase